MPKYQERVQYFTGLISVREIAAPLKRSSKKMSRFNTTKLDRLIPLRHFPRHSAKFYAPSALKGMTLLRFFILARSFGRVLFCIKITELILKPRKT